MKKILKSLIVLGVVLSTVGGSVAYFTSAGSATGNQIIAGTLRLAVDSTRTHTYSGAWNLFDAYQLWEDVDGVATFYQTLETWTAAAPGSYAVYTAEAGADAWPDGNHSFWVAYRNAGTIPMKVSADVTGGSWTVDPAIQLANGTCNSSLLDSYSTVFPRNVHFYQSGASGCENHEECQNLRDGLENGPWTPYTAFSDGTPAYAVDYSGNPITGVVYASHNGTQAGVPMVLNSQEFVIARVDVNFDTTAAGVNQNCYQGATFTYDLNGYAYQVGDPGW